MLVVELDRLQEKKFYRVAFRFTNGGVSFQHQLKIQKKCIKSFKLGLEDAEGGHKSGVASKDLVVNVLLGTVYSKYLK